MSKVPVAILGGHSPWKGLLGMIAFPDMLKSDQAFCRFFTYNSGTWGRLEKDFDFDVKSVTYLMEPSSGYKAWWLLGKNGEAVEIKAGIPTIEQIPDAGGALEAIKVIDGALYVCGQKRQVYRRSEGRWQSLSDDILTPAAGTGFFDIDGTAQDELYAVGWDGDIWFYDGKKWHQDVSPTTAHLQSLRCLASGDTWVCGQGGVVLRGRFNQWELIRDSDQRNWYAIEEYEGQIYLAGNENLACLNQGNIQTIDVGLGKAITTHRLHAKDGLLWSIGEKDILVFDGETWKEIPHPDNT